MGGYMQQLLRRNRKRSVVREFAEESQSEEKINTQLVSFTQST